MSFIRDGGDLWAFNPIIRNGVRRWKGTDFNNLVKQPDGKLDSSWPGVYGQYLNDDTYWINTSWKGTDGKLYAAVHIEYAYPGTAHGNSDSEWTWAFRKICLGSSSDQGATWHYEGEILSNANTALGDKSTYPGDYAPTGEGDPLLFIDEPGGYIYLYTYTAYYKKVNQSRGEWEHYGRALEVARSPISSNGASGSWKKFYNGAWNEPGIGGKATSVVKDSAWAAISYNSYLGKYVMIQTGDSATNISTATDMNTQNWTTPQYFSERLSPYLASIDQTTDSQYVTGQNFRLVYTSLGAGKYRDISFDKGTSAAPVTTTGPAQPQRYVFQSVDREDYMWKRNTLPMVDDKSTSITFTGNWSSLQRSTALQDTIRTTSENNAFVQFNAYGTDLYIWGDTSPSGGKADVYIDGAYVDTINYYYPAVSSNAILFAQKGLNLGHHTVKIINNGQKDAASQGTEITFDGYETAAGDVYQASAGFSSIQGVKNWSYQLKSGATYSDLTFETSALWPNPDYPFDFSTNDRFAFMQPALKKDRNNFYTGTSDTSLRVGSDYMVPGTSADAVRKWKAPRAGHINISGTVMKKSGSESGDGVVATIVKNNTVLWGPAVIANSDVIGQNFDVDTSVAAGDDIVFILNKNGDNTSDATLWNPTIFYGISGVVSLPPPQKEPPGGNIAQGKPATDDSSQPAQIVASGNDAYRTTRWSAPDGNANHWWRVDLGSLQQLISSEVDWELNNAYQYKIEVSNDDSNWVTTVDKTGNLAAAQVMKDDFNAVARYVRITVTGGVSNAARASFSEFKLYTLTSGKPATTDSFQAGREASKGNDGSMSTRWTAGNANPNHWWKVDLGEIYHLTSSEVNWEKSNAYKYKIEVSNDNAAWSTAVDKTGNTSAAKVMSDNFMASGRYVRITVTGGVSSNVWAAFHDFKLFAAPVEGMPATTLIAPTSVLAGQTFTTKFGLSGVTESVYAQDLKLAYDPSVMEYLSAVSVKNGVRIVKSSEGSPGQLRFILASEGPGHAIKGSADVMQLTFRAKSVLEPKSGRIALEGAILGDAAGHETNAALASVDVAVTTPPPGIPGDANGDNHVSIGDLAMIAANYGKDSSSADWQLVKKGDITGDNKIDIEDLVRVAVLITE